MKRTHRSCALTVGLALVLSTAGCVLPPPPGTLAPPRVEVLTADSRAARYGTTAAEVLEHPMLGEKVRALFTERGPGLVAPAATFFSKSSPPRALRIADRDYVAASGCMATACATRRGLLLVSDDGQRLLARIDDGGFTHDYGFGPGMVAMTPQDRLLIDAAWRALE